jgi:hypothetical protein
MKQCPVCDKEFDDSLRFCQVDGTPLVDKTEDEEVDPFKTMVGTKADILAAMPPVAAPPPPPEPSVPAPIENELLEIPPAADPNKTQFVSEEELRAEMAKIGSSENEVIDVPPLAEPEAPSFAEPEPTPSPFGGAPPPSPFATPNDGQADEPGPANFPTSPPIPSPFGASQPEEKISQDLPETPSPFEASASPEPAVNPFEPAPAAPIVQAEASSPVVPESNMQNPQNYGQGAAPAAGGPNQTLAIISLVVGILSIFCCGWFVPGIAAIIMGFIAKSKASNDPSNFGGAGLALGGIITGALSIVLGIIVVILYVFMGVGAGLMQGIN